MSVSLWEYWKNAYGLADERLREARAENARLRAALEEINNTDMYVAPMVRAIAARALQPEAEDAT